MSPAKIINKLAFRRLFFSLVSIIFGFNIQAQVDKTQYIPPFYAVTYSNGVDVGAQWIVLSTGETSPFDVSLYLAGKVVRTVTISKTQPDTIYLGTGYSRNGNVTGIVAEDSLNKVLRVQGYMLQADKPFFSAVYQKSGAQGDILTCKGKTALGQSFYSGHIWGAYSVSANARRSQFVSVMATFDGTVVTFSNPRVRFYGQSANTFSVTLNANECYVVGASYTFAQSAGYNINDYNGTKVTATKPIVVNTGSWCGSANSSGSQDMGIDQLVPEQFTGKEFVAVKGEGTPEGERVVVVATKAGTQLRVNGSLVYTFPAEGSYYDIQRTNYDATGQNLSITTTENVYVFQTLSGGLTDVSVGLCFIPPLSCLGNKDVNIAFPGVIGNPWLYLITEKGASVKINNINVTQTPQSVAGNANWVSYKIPNAQLAAYGNLTQPIDVVSTKALNAALALESGSIGGAGFYSGFGTSPVLDPKPTLSGSQACFPGNIVMTATGYSSYQWFKDNEVIPNVSSSTYVPTGIGQYKVRGITDCGSSKASDPFIVNTCLSVSAPATVAENVGSFKVKIDLGMSAAVATTYWYRTVSGTATSGADFVANSGVRTIPAGKSSDSITIVINDDLLDEIDIEDFRFEVYSADNATVQTPSVLIGIQDNDNTPKLGIAQNISVAENAGSATFEVVLSAASGRAVTVNYTTLDSTAKSGINYTGKAGLLTFNPGETKKTVVLPIIDDNITNINRFFLLNLSNITGALADSVNLKKTCTIVNDENLIPCISIDDASAAEGSVIKFKVNLSKAYTLPVTFKVALDYQGTTEADFVSVPGQLFTIPVGATSAEVSITTVDDAIVEGDENFVLKLINTTEAEKCDTIANGTIIDNDFEPKAVNDVFVCVEDAFVTGNVTLNDDIKGDTPVVVVFTPPANGVLSNTTTKGVFRYTPFANYFGADQFSYTVTDKSGDKSTATVLINVTAVNDVPIAVNDTVQVDEDNTLDIMVLKNDVDVDRQGLIVDDVTGAKLGVVQNLGSYIKYIPNAGISGTEKLSYTIQDKDGDRSSAFIFITINDVNEIPLANIDTITTNEDVPVMIDVLANDINYDAGVLSVTAVGVPSNGLAAIVAGKVLYTPAFGFFGRDSVTYTIADGQGDLATAIIYITVLMVNNAPIAVADTVQIVEDTRTQLNLLANDFDSDGTLEKILVQTQPKNGSLEFVGNLLFYTPNKDYFGIDSLTYKAQDNEGGISQAVRVRLIVTPVNDVPVPGTVTLTVPEDAPLTPVDVLAKAYDPDKGGLSIIFTQSFNGFVTVQSNKINYKPNKDFFGSDSVYYTIRDAQGDTARSVVYITVTPVSDEPVAVADSVTINEDIVSAIDVLANDKDIDRNGLTLLSVLLPGTGTAQVVAGKVVYTPKANYFGRDSMRYVIRDGDGDRDTATVYITILSVNDVPVAVNDKVSVNEDFSTTIDVLANDIDPDGGGLLLSVVKNALHGAVTVVANKLVYTPATDYFGSDSLQYAITDAQGDKDTATVFITVIAINELPVAINDTLNVNEDETALFDVLANDNDRDKGGLTLTSAGKPVHGLVTIKQNKIEYIPSPDFNGTDSLVYTITDAQNDAATAKLIISVLPVNDVPVAVLDSAIVGEDNPRLIYVLDNDIDKDKSGLTLKMVNGGYHGTITIVGNVLNYTPDLDYNGTDSLTYTIIDGEGDEATALVRIVVTGVNDYPVAVNDTISIAEDVITDIAVTNNDTDTDGSIVRVALISQPITGTAVVIGGTKVRYTPKANWSGTDSLVYVVYDNLGASSGKATVYITVTAVNDVPGAPRIPLLLNEDDSLTVNISRYLVDPDNSGLTMVSVSGAAHGQVSFTGFNVKYIPAKDFNGLDSAKYVIKDGEGDLSEGYLVYTVTPVNDAPVAVNDFFVMLMNGSLTKNILYNDYDVDENPFAGDVSILNLPFRGTAAFNGSTKMLTYTPLNGFTGRDSLLYQLTDTNGALSNTAWVTIRVDSANYRPRAQADTVSLYEDTRVTIDVIANDFDVQGDTLTAFVAVQPKNGLITANGKTITYIPRRDFFGTDTAYYACDDGRGKADTARVVFFVWPVNDLPVISVAADTVRYTEGSGWKNLVGNYHIVDVEADTITSIRVVLHNITTLDSVNWPLPLNLSLVTSQSGSTITMDVKRDNALGDMALVLNRLLYLNASENERGTRFVTFQAADYQGFGIADTMVIVFDNLNNPPRNSVRPYISGYVLPDSVLSVSTGSWADSDGNIVNYKYQWQYSADGFVGSFVWVGDNSNRFVVPDSISEMKFRCLVTAFDDGWPLPADSASTWSDTIATVNFRPTNILPDTIYVGLSAKTGNRVARLFTTDADTLDTFTYTLLPELDFPMFGIAGDSLFMAFDALFVYNDTLNIKVRTTDSGLGNRSLDKVLTVVFFNDLMPKMTDGFPVITFVTGNSVTALINANKPGTVEYLVIADSMQVPVRDSVLVNPLTMGTPLWANTTQILLYPGLESQNKYKLVIYLIDTLGINVSDVYVLPFTTRDITPPQFIENTPVLKKATTKTADWRINVSEPVKIYYVVTDTVYKPLNYNAIMVGTSALNFGEWPFETFSDTAFYRVSNLQSQHLYRLSVFAVDSAGNVSDIVYRIFGSRDETAPSFLGDMPQIVSVERSKITYRFGIDEPGEVFVHLFDGRFLGFDNEVIRDSLGALYYHKQLADRDSVYTVKTVDLKLNGTYKLAFAVRDTAGNFGPFEFIEFTYPLPIEAILYPALSATNVYLEVTDEVDYIIYNQTGEKVREGVFGAGFNRINVQNLSYGEYLVHIRGKKNNKLLRFIRTR